MTVPASSTVAKTWRSLNLILFAALLIAGCARLKQCAYEGFNRDHWQQPDKVIRALHLQPGNIVADLGSGGGYFTFKLAQAVAPTGKVYAVDIDREMVALIGERAKNEAPSIVEDATLHARRVHSTGDGTGGVCSTAGSRLSRPAIISDFHREG